MHKVEKSESEVTQLCPTLCDSMDCNLPGSSIRPWDFPGKSTGVGYHFLPQHLHKCDPKQILQTDLSVNKHPGPLGGAHSTV